MYWTDSASLNGPVHTNDGLYVCGAPDFNGDTDTYYNSPTSQNVAGTHAVRRAGRGAQPARLRERAGLRHEPATRRAAPTCRSRPRTPRFERRPTASVGGTGCLYTGPTTITLHNAGNVGKMDVTSPRPTRREHDVNAGCGPGNNLNLPANGVIYVQNVRARRRIRTTRRAPARRATAT